MNTDTWEALAAFGDTFTCYSSALAARIAAGDEPWQAPLDAGLHLVLTEEPDGLFGFSHFPPGLASTLGLTRRGTDDPGAAETAIRAELEAHGKVIVTGDGFHLGWHVAQGRQHVPHWFTLLMGTEGPELADPFDCQTELGRQRPARQSLQWRELTAIAVGLPGDDPVLALREAFALGDDQRPLPARRFGWLASGPPEDASRPADGVSGPDALGRLARHFRERGQHIDAYRQADDLWSIARHRAFFTRRAAAEPALAAWVSEYLAPLTARWAHVAPLLMQARLGVQAGRAPSSSLPDALDDLAGLESAAAANRPR